MPGLSNRPQHSRPRTEAVFLALVLLSARAAGEDLRADLPKRWRVGFAVWVAEGLASEHEYLRFSLPLVLRDRLARAAEHEWGEAEKDALAEELARRRVAAAAARVREIAARRDELLFADLPEGERAREAARLDAERRQVVEEMARFAGGAPYRGLIPDAVPIAFEPTELLEAPRASESAAAERSGVDLLVWGRLESVEDYLYWRVGCYSVLMRTELFAHEGVAAPESIAEALEREAVPGLAEAILGRPWASLAVVPKPREASVRVDGKSVGIGSVELPFLRPGPHHVEIGCEGYRVYSETVFLGLSERRTLEVALEALPVRPVTLATAPPGASVYREGILVGHTPLALELPLDSSLTVRLAAEGFFDRFVTLDARTPESVEVSLRRRLADTSSWQDLKRRRFYGALGAFALSIPLPLVSYAVALDSAIARTETVSGSREYETLTRRMDIAYMLYVGGLFVSAVLGFKMVRDLLDYVRYADDPAF